MSNIPRPLPSDYAVLYRYHGEWCYALWLDGQYDCSYPADCLDDDDFDRAAQAVRDELARPTLRVVGDLEAALAD
jgi:hypothetical protein